LFKGHAENAGGQAVGQPRVGAEDGDGGEIIGGPEGVRVDDVVVADPVHRVKTLVVAAGDQGLVVGVDHRQKRGAAVVDQGVVPGADDAALPGLALGLGTHRAQVAPHAQGQADQAALPGSLADLFHRVDLAHAAHIQAHLGVGQVDGAGLPVDDDVLDVAVLGGGGQLFLGGQLVVRVGGVGLGGLPVIVPDGQHAAHGDVQLAVGGVVHLHGQLQHIQDPLVHPDRGDAGVVVDGLDV